MKTYSPHHKSFTKGKRSQKSIWLSLLVLLVFSPQSNSSVLLTDFSSAIGVDALSWSPSTRTWTGTQVVGSLFNDGTGPFDLTNLLPTVVTNSSGLQAEVTAILNSSIPAGSFSITLENSAAQVIVANFNWSDFVVGQSKTVTKAFEASVGGNLATWNRSNVTNWNLASSGNGAAVSVTFNSLSAIPEPSSMSLILGASVIALALRKRGECSNKPNININLTTT